MRWFWIDRFDEFVRGRHATAVKNVSLAEEHMHDHFPGAALMPNSLIVEGMAQTAGLLVAEAIGLFDGVGLKVSLSAEHGWAALRDKLAFGALEAAHLLGPMPIALAAGLDGPELTG
jgi:3-hydroxyacyl-[acyl-carrier-protein] dehydratase